MFDPTAWSANRGGRQERAAPTRRAIRSDYYNGILRIPFATVEPWRGFGAAAVTSETVVGRDQTPAGGEGGWAHSRHNEISAAITIGPRNNPSSPNVSKPPMMPSRTHKNGSRAAPPISTGRTR
jgi:hypothetical protein